MSAVAEEVPACLVVVTLRGENWVRKRISWKVDVERFTLRKLNEMEN
jgi:hypothetical protein